MTYFIQPVLTDKAKTEVANAIANKSTVNFTRMVFGSGRIKTNIASASNVAQESRSIAVTQSVSNRQADTIRILGRLDNRFTGANTLHVNEIGLMARVGNGAEFLFMYTWAEPGDVIPPTTEATVVRDYEFNTTISTDAQVTVTYTIGTELYSTVEELHNVEDRLTQAQVDGETALGKRIDDVVATKQNKLTAGSNVTITGDTISTRDTIYNDAPVKKLISDGDMALSGRLDQMNITLGNKQNKLTAGENITLTDAGVISSKMYDDRVLKASKQDKLKPGENIVIEDDGTIDTDRPVQTVYMQNSWPTSGVKVGDILLTQDKSWRANTTDINGKVFNSTSVEYRDSRHREDKNNPHGVTKEQVGLGNVPNYTTATTNEATTGAVSNKLMTPLTTKQAIEKLAPPPPTATQAQANAGTGDGFMTAELTKQAILHTQGEILRLDQRGATDRFNPYLDYHIDPLVGRAWYVTPNSMILPQPHGVQYGILEVMKHDNTYLMRLTSTTDSRVFIKAGNSETLKNNDWVPQTSPVYNKVTRSEFNNLTPNANTIYLVVD